MSCLETPKADSQVQSRIDSLGDYLRAFQPFSSTFLIMRGVSKLRAYRSRPQKNGSDIAAHKPTGEHIETSRIARWNISCANMQFRLSKEPETSF